jgi:hypothetical protein
LAEISPGNSVINKKEIKNRMSKVSDQNVECPVCHGMTAHTDLDIHSNERIWICERCGFYSETQIIERAGRQFWQVTHELPMSADGRVAWPELETITEFQPVKPITWNRGEFGIMPGFEHIPDGFGTKVAE